MNKREYYETYVAPSKDHPSLLAKILGFEDRKRSVFDVGNLVLRFSNAAVLGYDRWGLNHEFPAGSMAKDQCCTYYWTLSPMIGGLVKGQPSVAVGVRGTLRDSEEEFEPLPGYDADYVDEQENIGIAFSDKPLSWPPSWPIEIDATGIYTDPVTQQSFEGIERPLDLAHAEGSGLRFPGVLNGKVVAPRETYFVVTDNDPLEGNTLESNGIGPLNVRVDVWGLQYDDILNQDFIVWWETFTNVGTDTLYEVYVGLVGDPDTPEQGGQEWTDDYSVFIQRDDPHMAEKLADTTDSRLLWDLAIIWDGNDKAEGFLTSGVAWIGLKALKTPYSQAADGVDNDLDGVIDEGFDGVDNDGDGDIDENDEQEEIGITNYFAFPYSLDAQSDNEAYFTQIRGGLGHDNSITGYQEAPHTKDIEQKPYAYGPDITVVMTSGPITLAPGQSVDFVFADIVGVNETDLLNNTRTAQLLFNADFKAPQPPDEPLVYGVAGDGEITLYWDAYPSEYSVDPFTGNNAFEGYRIYRSTDRGATWGDPVTDGKGNTVFYKPMAVYDAVDNWSGLYAYGSPAAYYDLGSNSGLQYTFTDKSVVNGVEYWYAVSAYDTPDGIIPPLENPPKKSRSDALAQGNNTVILIPQARQAGFEEGTTNLDHLTGKSTASLSFTLYDPARLSGYEYLVSVTDDLDATDDTTKNFSVLNTHRFSIATDIALTGTSLPHRNILESSVAVSGPEGEKYEPGADFSVDGEEGKIYSMEGGTLARQKGVSFTVSYQYYPILESTLLEGETSNPNFEGVRLTVQDVGEVAQDLAATYWYSAGGAGGSNWTATMSDAGDGKFNADDYEFRFTGSSEILNKPGAFVPFELWNVSDTVKATFLIVVPPPQSGDTASIASLAGARVTIVEVPNDETELASTWQFQLLAPEPATASLDTFATVLCDTTQPGNGLYDEGEPYTDLDTSGTWDAGEPFVDCYFDTASALTLLDPGISNMSSAAVDTLASICSSPQLDTTITSEIVDVFQFDLQTLTFDTIPGLKVTATVSALCDTSVTPLPDDALFVGTTKPLTPEDTYLIQTSTSTAILTEKEQLEQVRVVPNPYVVTSFYETNVETKELQFHHLPEASTIRIFTLAGELLRVIEHKEGSKGWRGPSVEAWDLRTYNNQEVAFGIYIFQVEAKGATETFSKVGKFAVIR
ncbi:MAG: hypothetical protein ACE5GH_01780 [Fidelibacterota bacterium]